MPVSINMPSAPQQREKETDLDKVIKGLNIAQSVYGIYADTQKLSDMSKSRALAEEKAGQEKEVFLRNKDIFDKEQARLNAALTPQQRELIKNATGSDLAEGTTVRDAEAWTGSLSDLVKSQTAQKSALALEMQKHKNSLELQRQKKLAEGGTSKPSEAQKALDKKFGEEYAEWTSGGSEVAKTDIKKLDRVIADMESGKVQTGGFTGVLGDRGTSDEVLKARAAVTGISIKNLKEVLGSQLTESDRIEFVKNLWNEAEGTENNLERVKDFRDALAAKADAKDFKSRYFEENNTLYGYRQPNVTGLQAPPPGGYTIRDQQQIEIPKGITVEDIRREKAARSKVVRSK